PDALAHAPAARLPPESRRRCRRPCELCKRGRRRSGRRAGRTRQPAFRHTFASRLVAAGVDLRTVQEPGGWRTLSKVQRYVHLSPGHLAAAVEKIVATPAVVAPRAGNSSELRQNFESAEAGSRTMRSKTRTQTSEILGAEGWPSPVEGVRLEIGSGPTRSRRGSNRTH